MLYELDLDADPSSALEPIEFKDLDDVNKVEKDLEEIISKNLVDYLFQEARLLPIFQERQWQEEGDMYAIDPNGDLVIFELKRKTAQRSAVNQLLRYSEKAGKWKYKKLNDMYKDYVKGKEGEVKYPQSLQERHQEAHGLQEPLQPHEFNRQQKLRIVGNAADEDLIETVDYWKRQGLSIDYVPYRLYDLDSDLYFEFFSLPYDRHRNPGEVKGVLFDTNASWDEDAIWEMMEKKRVAAYGDAKKNAKHVEKGDYVFFYHKGKGIIAAGKVNSRLKKDPENEEWYRDVEFKTKVPKRSEGVKSYMSPSDVIEATGQTFFWARTIKVPYLDRNEAKNLLSKLKKELN